MGVIKTYPEKEEQGQYISFITLKVIEKNNTEHGREVQSQNNHKRRGEKMYSPGFAGWWKCWSKSRPGFSYPSVLPNLQPSKHPFGPVFSQNQLINRYAQTRPHVKHISQRKH